MGFSGVSVVMGWAGASELASTLGLPEAGAGLMRGLVSSLGLPGPRAGLMWWPASAFELPGPKAGPMRGLPGPAASLVNVLPVPAFYGATALTISKFPFDGGTPGMRFSSITALRTTVVSSTSALRLIVISSTNIPQARFSRMASLRTPPFPAPPFSLSFLPLFPALRLPDPHSFPRRVSAASP